MVLQEVEVLTDYYFDATIRKNEIIYTSKFLFFIFHFDNDEFNEDIKDA